MHVLLVLCQGDDDRVLVSLHCLHDDVLALTAMMPCASAVRVMALPRVRQLLCALEGLRAGPQQELERASAAAARAGVRHGLRAVASPILYHDACTLYAALVLSAVGAPSWVTAPRPCSCGHNAWGVTCTPPAIRKGRLTRDALDQCVAFCWTCLARQERLDLDAAPALGLDAAAPEAMVSAALTHMAPQKSA